MYKAPLENVLTPEQLNHVKSKARGVVRKTFTWMGRIIFALGGHYYVLGYTKTGVHIDVYATIKVRTWHPIIILGGILQLIWNVLTDLWANITTLFELFDPKQFPTTEKITSFVIHNNLKKK